MVTTLSSLGILHREQDCLQESFDHLQEALVVYRAVGDVRFEVHTVITISRVHIRWGQLDVAAAVLEQGDAVLKGVEDPMVSAGCLVVWAEVEVMRGHIDCARTLLDRVPESGLVGQSAIAQDAARIRTMLDGEPQA